MRRLLSIASLSLFCASVSAQTASINGQVVSLQDDTETTELGCTSLECKLDDAGVSYMITSDLNVGLFNNTDVQTVCNIAADMGLERDLVITTLVGDTKTVTDCLQ